jgi:phospholipid/cholesterol/gamma-HCH transport system substrate-binding protein
LEPQGRYAIVGAFVLLLGVAMIASIFWLAGWGRGSEEIYLVFMEESVSGLDVEAPVKFRGVNVGRVASLDLSPGNPEVVLLTLSIRPDVPILTDTRAQLEFQGLTGLAFVNLVGGTRGAETLRTEPGQDYPVIQSSPSILVRLDNGVSELLVSVTETSNHLAGILQEIDPVQLASIVASLERLSSALADSSAGMGNAVANAERFLDSAAQVGDRLPGLVDDLDALVQEWQTTSREIRQMTTDGSDELARVSGDLTGNVQVMTSDLRRLTDRLEQTLVEIGDDPSMFLYGRTVAPRGPGE